jgi:diguanylate cyclase (GGDEF)-like protein
LPLCDACLHVQFTVSLSLLFDALATTTAHRDRDALDEAVARILFDAIKPQRITVYRLVDDVHDTRVQRRCEILRNGATTGPEVVDTIDKLPSVRSQMHWLECVTLNDIVHYEAPGSDALHSLFPLSGERTVNGMLEIEAGDGLDPREAQLVKAILGIVCNHLALLDYGERDTLTGLLNRKTFEHRFGKIRKAQVRGDPNQPSWLGVVDIDKFKSINDNFGHLFGDEVLLLVSRLMRETFRGGDDVFRFGGEEFVVVLHHASHDGAVLAFERLRQKVAQHAFPQVGKVTVSVGFTKISPRDSPSAAFERADQALYFAKNHGRDQVRGYDRLLADGEIRTKELQAVVELF